MAKVWGFQDKNIALGLKQVFRDYALPGVQQSFPHRMPSTHELVRFKNGSEEDCPGGACLKVVSESEDEAQGLYSEISLPDGKLMPGGHLINIAKKDTVIAPGDFGWAVRAESAVMALIEELPPDYVPGHFYGPVSGSWILRRGRRGFIGTGHAITDEETSSVYGRILQTFTNPVQRIQINSGGTLGEVVQATAEGVFLGKAFGAAGNQTVDIYIAFSDYTAFQPPAETYAINGKIYDGFYSDLVTSDFGELPMYTCAAGLQLFLAQTATAVAKSTSPQTFKLYNADRTYSGFTIQAIPLGDGLPANKWLTVRMFEDGQWYAGCWEK